MMMAFHLTIKPQHEYKLFTLGVDYNHSHPEYGIG